MRLGRSHHIERFGAVHLHELARVIELDSGGERSHTNDHGGSSVVVSQEAIRAVERDTVIVIPCKNEIRTVIEGVLSGIPHDCLIVLVSNSSREPIDRYDIEAQTVERFARYAERSAVTIHQRDPGLASALKAAGLPAVVDDDGLVRHGKGEGMLIGMALAALTGRRYIGYVDADNYVPGAVNEYCKAFAAGLHLADGPYGMVRVAWHSKPKLLDGRLYFSRRGRTSEVTNRFLNRLLAEYSGFETDVIATGNAGDHALTLELGLRLRTAGGFAVEPFQYLDLFEQFGGVVPAPDRADPALSGSVPVVQIESRNPHFHEDKGVGHVHGMRMQALNALYHSPVALPGVRREIIDLMVAEGALAGGEEPPQERIYPPVGSLALDVFLDTLVAEAQTLRQVEPLIPVGRQAAAPVLRWSESSMR